MAHNPMAALGAVLFLAACAIVLGVLLVTVWALAALLVQP